MNGPLTQRCLLEHWSFESQRCLLEPCSFSSLTRAWSGRFLPVSGPLRSRRSDRLSRDIPVKSSLMGRAQGFPGLEAFKLLLPYVLEMLTVWVQSFHVHGPGNALHHRGVISCSGPQHRDVCSRFGVSNIIELSAFGVLKGRPRGRISPVSGSSRLQNLRTP